MFLKVIRTINIGQVNISKSSDIVSIPTLTPMLRTYLLKPAPQSKVCPEKTAHKILLNFCYARLSQPCAMLFSGHTLSFIALETSNPNTTQGIRHHI